MSDEPRNKLRPTIVPSPTRGVKNVVSTKVADVRQQAGHPAPGRPTTIAGTLRERIPVTANELHHLSPGTAKQVIDRSLSLLAGFVVEKVTERKALLWGHDLQKSYGDLVAAALLLSQAPVMRKMQGHVARAQEILGGFDLASTARSDSPGVGRFLKGMNKKTDTLAEVEAARRELDQIVQFMRGGLDELLSLRDKLEQNARTLEMIAGEAEAAALAALFLSQHLRSRMISVADRFAERSMSLTQTLAQIRGNSALHDIQREHPIRMIGAIQNVTLVSMPDFLSSLAALETLAMRNASLSPTEASELTYKLRAIVQQLTT